MADLIDRQAAIDAILNINDYGNSDRANALGLAEFAITTLPSAQPELKTGHWIETDIVIMAITDIETLNLPCKVCSECGNPIAQVMWNNYCPNCGAKMEVENGTKGIDGAYI